MMIIYEIEPEAEHYSDNKCPSYEKETSKKMLVKRFPHMDLELKSGSEFRV